MAEVKVGSQNDPLYFFITKYLFHCNSKKEYDSNEKLFKKSTINYNSMY